MRRSVYIADPFHDLLPFGPTDDEFAAGNGPGID